MKVAKKIRLQLRLEPWPMALKLGKKIQSYQRLERITVNCNIRDLLKLHDVAVYELGWTEEEFINELRKEVNGR